MVNSFWYLTLNFNISAWSARDSANLRVIIFWSVLLIIPKPEVLLTLNYLATQPVGESTFIWWMILRESYVISGLCVTKYFWEKKNIFWIIRHEMILQFICCVSRSDVILPWKFSHQCQLEQGLLSTQVGDRLFVDHRSHMWTQQMWKHCHSQIHRVGRKNSESHHDPTVQKLPEAVWSS